MANVNPRRWTLAFHLIFEVFVLLALVPNMAKAGTPTAYQTGDLIFHMSSGRQAAAINEAQGSPYTHMGVLVDEGKSWVVYEAVQPVKKTPLNDWIARGKKGHFVVKRIRADVVDMSDAKVQKVVVDELSKFMDLDYDIFFQWSDETIYCSELAYKAYLRAINLPVGVIQKVGDLNLGGPNIQKLIRERERLLGRPIDLEEPIITPIAVMDSELLVTVK